jgi:hypothetical protein
VPQAHRERMFDRTSCTDHVVEQLLKTVQAAFMPD